MLKWGSDPAGLSDDLSSDAEALNYYIDSYYIALVLIIPLLYCLELKLMLY